MKFKWSTVTKIYLFLFLFSLLFSFKVLSKENLDWYGDSNSISNQDWDLYKAKHL